MNDNQIYTFGMIVGAFVTALGMQAENMQREALGDSMAYTDSDFHDVLMEYAVTHNGITQMLNGGE